MVTTILATAILSLTGVQATNAQLKKLEQGNARFVAGKVTNPNRDAARLMKLRTEQKPFAAVLACADSRLAPEILFDQGLGDLFVVRVAGNVAETYVMASMDYAVEHLHVPILVVMSHSNCGAVIAAVESETHRDYSKDIDYSDTPKTLIDQLLIEIRPAMKGIDLNHKDYIGQVTHANVRQTAKKLLEKSAVVRDHVKSGELTVVTANYDLTTNKVTFDPKPMR